MDLRLTEDELAFRGEVRAFVHDNLPASIREKTVAGRRLSKDDYVRWTRILAAKGWGSPALAAGMGRPGWSPVKLSIFLDETQRGNAPELVAFGVNMVGPVIYTFGSRAQKQRFLPRIIDLSDWWCQGFSEPGAGSDLASLRTSARCDADDWVISGQKTWTTMAQYADWIFVLARTNAQAKKQEGISFFLVDMKTPGITVKPIQTIDGGHEVNEVFFDDVRVPADALVGEENKGWDYAKFLLANERNGIARVGVSKARLDRVRQLASIPVYGSGPKIEDPFFRAKLAEVEVELKALEMTQMRVISNRGNAGKPDPASSVLKIKGSEIQQATTELLMEVVGPYALPYREPDDMSNEPPVGSGLGRAARADLLQQPQGFDLRRIERNPAQHHRQGDPGALKHMDFELSPEQELLRDNVARLMKERYGFDARKTYQAAPQGWSKALWGNYAEMGLLGAPFAEADGGFGGGAVESMIVMEQFGKALALEPYLQTVVLCGALLKHEASDKQRAELIGAIAGGELRLSFAHMEKQSGFDLHDVALSAVKDGDGFVLNGEKTLVGQGDSADKLIVSARVKGERRDRDGVALFLVGADASGVSRRGYPTQDGQRAAEISFANVRVAPQDVLGSPAAHCRRSSGRSTRQSRRSPRKPSAQCPRR